MSDCIINICVGVPFYKNAALAHTCLTRLQEIDRIIDTSKVKLSYIFINDSPDDSLLKAVISSFVFKNNHFTVDNLANLGFLKSANKIFEFAKSQKAHCLILNSDAMLTCDAMLEMLTAFENDDRVRFVFPRSNNATIATITPSSDLVPFGSEADCFSFFVKCRAFLPRYTYTPTAVGFCLLIHSNVLLDNFLLDEKYGMGYEEENDLIMRVCNLGYRCTMANHAFVYHIGSVSFESLDGSSSLDTRKNNNSILINTTHPYYANLVKNYISSSHYLVEKFAFKIASNSSDLIFDMMNASAIGNGTNKVAINILKNIVLSKKFNTIYVWSSDEIIQYLKNILPNDINAEITYTNSIEHLKVDVFFRPGQPFSIDQLFSARLAARVLVYYFFDTIAIDCPYLKTEKLDFLWRAMIQINAIPVFLSKYTQIQFDKLYGTKHKDFLNNSVVYPAFTTDLILPQTINDEVENETNSVLVFGNLHDHKYLEKTVDLLLKNTNLNIVVTCNISIENNRLTQYKSGHISDSDLANLIGESCLIVYPSHYEGFGLVVTEALSLGKKIVCRRLEPYLEIIEEMKLSASNIYFYENDNDLIFQINMSLNDAGLQSPVQSTRDWSVCTNQILEVLFSEAKIFDAEKIHASISLVNDFKLQYDDGMYAANNHNIEAALTAKNQNIEAALAANKLITTQLRDELDNIKRSRSWLITQPIRKIVSKFKLFFNR